MRTFLATLLILPLLAEPTWASNANFGDAAIRQINQEGFRNCKRLGRTGYTGQATGINEGGSGQGATPFRIRSCFATLAECERFLERVPALMGQVNVFRSRKCFPRG